MCWQWCKVTLRPRGRCCWVGWGLRGPRSFSFDGKQLSYPIMHNYDSYLPSLPCPIKAGWKTSGHHGNSAEICSYTLKEWDSHVTFQVWGKQFPAQLCCVTRSSPESWQKKHLHKASSASASQCVNDVPGYIFAGTGLHSNRLFGFDNLKVKLAVCLALCLRLFPLLWGTDRETHWGN